MITVRVGILGDRGVGKTTLVRRFIGSNILCSRSINVAMKTLHFWIQGRSIKLNILVCDFRCDKLFTFIIQRTIRTLNSIIIMYDISRRNTFSSVANWINFVLRSVGRIPMVLVGNKVDLRGYAYDCVSFEEGKRYAEILREEYYLPIIFLETSAQTGYNVEKVFLAAAYLGIRARMLRRRMRLI